MFMNGIMCVEAAIPSNKPNDKLKGHFKCCYYQENKKIHQEPC